MKILVTGVAGFIGNELALRLCQQGHEVIGLDNINDYYDVQLKQDRLERLRGFSNFRFLKVGVEDRAALTELAQNETFEQIFHMAAQAGVRYSLTNPAAYIDANLVGFGNILELARQQQVAHLVFASSSSVYGESEKQPFSEEDRVDHPVSLYAATKKSNELMAHAYSHLYRLPVTGLRFFTVYGPWGRPDMAPFLFSRAILEGTPIKVFNHGNMLRDFTYIDDVVEGILLAAKHPVCTVDAAASEAAFVPSDAPYQILNIGNSAPVKLERFIAALEAAAGRPAEKIYMDMQPGDVSVTYADTHRLKQLTGYQPTTDIETGLTRLVQWYRDYYQL